MEGRRHVAFRFAVPCVQLQQDDLPDGAVSRRMPARGTPSVLLRDTSRMGSRRYWIVVGVLAALVGFVVFAVTGGSSAQPAAYYEIPSTSSEAPDTTIPAASSTTTTTEPSGSSSGPPGDGCELLPDGGEVCGGALPPPTTTLPPLPTTTVPELPETYGGPDWLNLYYPIPPVLSGQVIDLDDDGEPDVGLFGAAESPLIYPIENDAEDLENAQLRVERLEEQVDGLEQLVDELRAELSSQAGSSPPQQAPQSETGSTAPPVSADATTTTAAEASSPTVTIKPGEGSQSSGLTPTQESLLLALISTGGVVLAGIGAPVMTAWGKRKFGTSDE